MCKSIKNVVVFSFFLFDAVIGLMVFRGWNLNLFLYFFPSEYCRLFIHFFSLFFFFNKDSNVLISFFFSLPFICSVFLFVMFIFYLCFFFYFFLSVFFFLPLPTLTFFEAFSINLMACHCNATILFMFESYRAITIC